MSLSTVANIAIGTLSRTEEGLTVSANNLANINTDGYIRQKMQQESIVVNGVGQGARANGISADIDPELLKLLRVQVSSLGSNTVLDDFYNNIQRLYGQPGSNNSLTDEVAQFFSAYQALSNNPETPSLRVAALNAAKDVATKISGIANDLQGLRFSADINIKSAVNTINTALTDLASYNLEILNFKEGSSGFANTQQKITSSLQTITEYINISSSLDSRGRVSVLTGNGASLIDDATIAKLEYSQVSSVETFKNDATINAIKIRPLNTDGTPGSSTYNLTTSGSSTTITTSLTDGSIYGLLQMRDSIIPDLILQLDTLADAITNEVNAVHNNGYGFPPPSSLTGTTAVTNLTEVDFTGKVRIAVINNDGTPAPSPYSDEEYYRPLTLDFTTLNSGAGVGRSTVQTMIDEINDYFGPVQNRAVVGNLRDIQLVAVSDSLADAGTAQFDLQLDNTSTKASTVVIQSITVTDPVGAYPASVLPVPNTYTIAAGERSRTSIPFTINFGAGADAVTTPYTVTVSTQVTDASGNVSVADIEYVINDAVTGIRNDRYVAQDVTNVSGTSAFIVAPGASTYASASLVNANGSPVAAGQTGFLKITTSSGRNYGVVIDELDSKEVGVPTASAEDVTNRGFSHYFGLNNLFVDNGAISGSALNMTVRSDIKTNPSLLTTGQLVLSKQPADPTTALYSYQAGSGNNKAAITIAELNQKSVFFSSAGNLPGINTTFGNYSADIIGSVATSALQTTNTKDAKQVGMDGLLTLLQKSAGVNSDEELALIMEFQREYGVSGRLIAITKEMFDTLLGSFR